MITIEEIIAAHLAVRTEAEWNELAAAVEYGICDGDPRSYDDMLTGQFLNDEYLAVSEKLGLNRIHDGGAIANVGGNDVFATENETGNWEARDFQGVMDSYRRAIADADSE